MEGSFSPKWSNKNPPGTVVPKSYRPDISIFLQVIDPYIQGQVTGSSMGGVVSWSTATYLGRLCLCTQRAFDDHWKAQRVRRAENGIGIITQGSSKVLRLDQDIYVIKLVKRYLERTTRSNYSNVCLFEPFPLFPAKWHHWHRLVIKSWLSASLAKPHWDTSVKLCLHIKILLSDRSLVTSSQSTSS